VYCINGTDNNRCQWFIHVTRGWGGGTAAELIELARTGETLVSAIGSCGSCEVNLSRGVSIRRRAVITPYTRSMRPQRSSYRPQPPDNCASVRECREASAVNWPSGQSSSRILLRSVELLNDLITVHSVPYSNKSWTLLPLSDEGCYYVTISYHIVHL